VARASQLSVPVESRENEVQEVVSAFALQARRQLEHDRLSIYLLTPDGLALERFAVATSPAVPGERDIQPLEQVGLARVLRSNEPIVSADFGTDERILGEHDLLIAEAGFHALVSVPLRLGGEPFGLLNFVSRTPGFYREEDVAVAQQIADQVAVFLQNLRLHRAVRLSVEREAIERERTRVARELHDTAAQKLAEIVVRLDQAAAASASGPDAHVRTLELRRLAAGALEDVRRSLLSLDPAGLDGPTLVDAVRRPLVELEQVQGTRTRLVVLGDPGAADPEDQATLFRVFQEALDNVRRHSQASRVVVTVDAVDGLALTVGDDGRGFDPEAEASGGRFGIRSMHARAAARNGRLFVSSSPGAGTEVTLRLPSPARPSTTGSLAATPRRVHRVLVVDDQAVFREGLGALLDAEPDLHTVGFASTAEQALTAARVLRPDVVVLDAELPDTPGADLVALLSGESGGQPVVVLASSVAGRREVESGLAAGARGLVSKAAAPSAFVEAIRSAIRGATVVDSGGRPTAADASGLTPRELQILRSIAAGATNAEIAEELHLAGKTIERVVATITSKLGARNRTHAVARALELRLIRVP
jgi:signal transduction histidine kinase/DNA-binding NarL/FixJ family response regulator